ncbi:Cardio acceleratory peptide 2b [Papilio machaon]|uniref:Cardio acceleratory peptide 2b n=1 Tax=Papilio machaon TaxID=76193 RepID=A0A194R720_PAPMA|nr:Cardio acceleratory peptide 2b [Papilio machaon]
MIKEEVKSEKNPLIYINNPVESKFPNAYLTLEEFKQALTNRILAQRETTKKLHLRMRNELITTRFISNQHSKMITKNPRNYIRSKSILATKLSTKVTLENVIATNMNITNFTKILTANNAPNSQTTFEINRETFKGEEILTTEPSKIYTDKITDAVTRSKESIENSTVTLFQANIDNYTTQDYPKTDSLTYISDSSTVTVKNTESLNKTETFETESPKTNLEVATKVATSNESDMSKNMRTVSTSLHTEDVTQKENSTEEVRTEVITEKEKTRDEISTVIVKDTTSITTRSTRRTLGNKDANTLITKHNLTWNYDSTVNLGLSRADITIAPFDGPDIACETMLYRPLCDCASSAKLRRDGVLNLYPFPRVGRAHHTWQVPVNDQYLDSELASKRQLYAFPRVGRGDFGYLDQSNLNRINLRLEELLLGQQLLDHPRSNDYVKRESESTSTGMWFGPRVGRSFNNDDIINREEDKDSDSEESAERIERKKRQTKRA